MLTHTKEFNGTKLEIINTAMNLFATFGFSKTSIRKIARKADVNIAAVNYHFGTKENLYKETIHYFVRNNMGIIYGKNSDIQSNTGFAKTENMVRQQIRKIATEESPEFIDDVVSALIKSQLN